ncbi:hypothetical protein IE53DRAFT_109652 [Violaceomyces palustris]|uniref:Uncharacterized protein n=1 Tax=Violaceomyces palustris TaxID=1673888 RepID=A0ACD0NWD7_9BASI|nr:hypothetical protein IE53DRAFT_109652 [Violaceomyces palustris]
MRLVECDGKVLGKSRITLTFVGSYCLFFPFLSNSYSLTRKKGLKERGRGGRMLSLLLQAVSIPVRAEVGGGRGSRISVCKQKQNRRKGRGGGRTAEENPEWLRMTLRIKGESVGWLFASSYDHGIKKEWTVR